MTTSTLTQPPEIAPDKQSEAEGGAAGKAGAGDPEISVVIPLLNEEESIPHLYRALTDAMESYGRSYEVIIVDDGSRDRSFALLKEIAEKFNIGTERVRQIREKATRRLRQSSRSKTLRAYLG